MKPDLVISTLPPRACGIASYAAQGIARRRAAGCKVVSVALGDDANRQADACLNLAGRPDWAGLFALGAGQRWREVAVHYAPELFAVSTQRGRRNKNRLLWLLRLCRWRAERLTIIVHEYEDSGLATSDQALFRLADRLLFHTDRDQDGFRGRCGADLRADTVVRPHGRDFAEYWTGSRAEARAQLGLDPDTDLLLCIGFIQPGKGFDAAVSAFAALDPSRNTALRIVGTARRMDHAAIKAMHDLKSAVDAVAGAGMVTSYVDDADFDRWICAADLILLPYRKIWSSGVAERAMLHGRPIVARALPGLRAQLADRPGVVWFDRDQDLAAAITKGIGRAAAA